MSMNQLLLWTLKRTALLLVGGCSLSPDAMLDAQETLRPAHDATATSTDAQPHARSEARAGINLAGAEFGDKLPGVFGIDYIYPSPGELDYFRARGRTLIRLPFKWERIQHSLYAPLDKDELMRIRGVLHAAAERKMDVILDVHNYGRYQIGGEEDQVIGSERVPDAAFADLWGKLAHAVTDESSVYAFGLMNEPHDMGDPQRWPRAAQAAVDAIRRVDTRTIILVPGDHWSGARGWRDSTNKDIHLKVRDPHNNLMFEAHCYFDKDGSGTYQGNGDAAGVTPDTGVEYVRSFVEWCRENRLRGFIGEYGVPDTDSRWVVTMDRFLAYLKANGISSSYWAAGPWWGDYSMSIEPEGLEPQAPEAAIDRPQMVVLRRYPG